MIGTLSLLTAMHVALAHRDMNASVRAFVLQRQIGSL